MPGRLLFITIEYIVLYLALFRNIYFEFGFIHAVLKKESLKMLQIYFICIGKPY